MTESKGKYMQNNLNIRGEPIQSVYSGFRKGQYVVNRRYQRKLVWKKHEKQKFIDSIIKQFPVPLFLGVTFQDVKKGTCFEILDGMQRLEAITSFIEGRYSVNGKYFDLSVISETNDLLKSGTLRQNSPVLDRDTCSAILSYPLPISTTGYSSSANVDETFRRINTGGIRLSRHEVRQAGALSEFAQLVRRCATYIRGDTSHLEIVDLRNMHEISLTHDDLDYGIKIRRTFWNAFHILTEENILASRDEELIAHTLLYILFKEKSQTSSKYLDSVYSPGDPLSDAASDAVLKVGIDNLYKYFCHTFDILKSVLEEGNTNLAQYLYSGEAQKIGQAYQVIFITVYQKIITENKAISNKRKLSQRLKGIASNCMPILFKDVKWLNKHRSQLVDAVSGVLSDCFIDNLDSDPATQSWLESFENILNQSRTENVCYDFKCGLHDLKENAKKEPDDISKIVKTLCAMHNSHIGSSYVLLGVADNDGAALRHEQLYGQKARKYEEFKIVGIGAEAQKVHRNIDGYQQYIFQKIESLNIDDSVKRNITRNVRTIRYYDKDIVVLKIDRMAKPALFEGMVYVRKLANVDPKPVSQEDMFEFFEEFKAQGQQYPYSSSLT
ncbi:GmrSD restriction endonuclease domain-containing protein [Agrobacterium sp. ST15.13.015]|uniref:GmrSD restriction endonuclease domain-containing protein n=2 Tax=Bacteria TaxID=2 RepID=UPI0022C00FF0|nr:DUF262 domain-containing protein [Agrobacterium sp. ST15.13.015]MCZ7498677.1 DUF262 domain-containing protein [Rhizobium rhizogenes]